MANEKEKGDSVFWLLLSGTASLIAGLLGVITADSFQLWSWLLIFVGLLAIIQGWRKKTKDSRK